LIEFGETESQQGPDGFASGVAEATSQARQALRQHAPVVVAARRTPIGVRGRTLAAYTVDQLAAPVIRAVVADASTWMNGSASAGRNVGIADVVLGNCLGPGGNPARVAALAAGLGDAVPGVTIDRQCGSGLAAIIEAANAIRAGDERPRIAGGVESPSTAPIRSIDGVPYSRAPFAPAGHPDPDMVQAAENLAAARSISRERQDAFAARGHERAQMAADRGAFDDELVALPPTTEDHRSGDAQNRLPAGGVRDDGIGSVSPSTLARFPALFPGGTLTAGTSSRISDGAAAVLLAPAGSAPGLALVSHATVGCDPALPGLGAAPAIREALERAGLDTDAIAAFEIVEAFSSQTLAVLESLGLADDDPRVCADGGALALGHPWGASGAVSVVRLFSRLVSAGAPAGTLGIAAASVGGGLGVAAVFEVVR
jgi:acetyl-CoA C-acetyltransferase